MSGLIRKYIAGEGWQTVVDDGGGGSFNGGTITEPLVIDTRGVTGEAPLNITSDAGSSAIIYAYDGDGNYGLSLDRAVGLRLWSVGDGSAIFRVGPTGAVTISPSDPAAIALQIDDSNGDEIVKIYDDAGDGAHRLEIKATDLLRANLRMVEADGSLFFDWVEGVLNMYSPAGEATIKMYNEDGVQSIVLTGGSGVNPGQANLGRLSAGQTNADLVDATAITVFGFSGVGNLLDLQNSNFVSVFRVTAEGGVIFPSADPLVAGAWWDDAGTLTRSAG